MSAPDACSVCGCTDNTPCIAYVGDEAIACEWVARKLCSACLTWQHGPQAAAATAPAALVLDSSGQPWRRG